MKLAIQDNGWLKERQGIASFLLGKGGKVLDVGTGSCPCMALALAMSGFEVITIDKSEAALEAAREVAESRGLNHRIDFRQADATKLPFPGASFANIVAYESLNHMEDPGKAIEEIARVCCRRGRAVIVELNSQGREEFDHPKDDQLLDKVDGLLRGHFSRVARIDRAYSAIFICAR